MPTADVVAKSYAAPIRPFGQFCSAELPPIWCIVAKHAKVTGHTKCDEVDRAPIEIVLREKWDHDLHFSQYDTQAAIRVNKNRENDQQLPDDLKFGLAAFDLDFGDHRKQPSWDDYAQLIRILFGIDEMPNIWYQTQHGARIIYFIDPISDPEIFESHRYALFEQLDGAFRRNRKSDEKENCIPHAWWVDPTKDWTRLFRAPRATRQHDSGRVTLLHDRYVGLMHDGLFNLLKLKIKAKKKRTERAERTLIGGPDSYLSRLEREYTPGKRNNVLIKAQCHILRHWAEDIDCRNLIEAWRGIANDLPEIEFNNCLRSAQKYTGRHLYDD